MSHLRLIWPLTPDYIWKMFLRAALLISAMLSLKASAQSSDAASYQEPAPLYIFFADSLGRYYNSTPQLQLFNAGTDKLVKQFHRFVDTAGNPDPVLLPPGNYDLRFPPLLKMPMHRISIRPGRHNQATIRINSFGTLRFRYATAGKDTQNRIKEDFVAKVKRRLPPDSVEYIQPCTDARNYFPGNYYVEVNTLPPTRFYVDIDWWAITEIQIKPSGFARFEGGNTAGTIGLYAPMGDKLVLFKEIVLPEGTARQPLRLKPGNYEARWTLPGASGENMVSFIVKPKAVTRVLLK